LRRSTILDALTPQEPIYGKKVRLRSKQLQDAAADFRWRTDVELCKLDASQPLTSSFKEYVRWYQEELYYITQGCHFAIDTLDGEHIGNCSYFNFDDIKQEAEMGIMIGEKKYWDRDYGADAIETSLKYVFSHSPIEMIHLKTLDWNYRAHHCFEKCGFAYSGTIASKEYFFLTMKIHRTAVLPQTDSHQ
jgi:RimJ/RimL family protein N-acetyltransferase